MADREERHQTAVAYQSAVRVEIAAVAGSRAAKKARQQLETSRRIAIVTKFRFMGDTIVAIPFFQQLRRHYPNAHITLLTSPTAATALQNSPDLDAIVPLEKKRKQRIKHIRELLTTLRSGNYDAAFLLNRSLECAIVCQLAGVPVRIGYVNEYRAPFLTLPIPYTWDRNEVDCHLDMLRALGLPVQDGLPTIYCTEIEQENAREMLRANGWPGNAARPLIGIQPGANDPHIREWSAERYAHVADALIAETGGSVLILGGGSEAATAARMKAAMQNPALDLTGKMKLRDALAIVGQCDLWLGNDSGLLHAAVSQRVPSVGLFGPNKVVRWGYDTPRHRSLVVFPERPARCDADIRQCLDAIPESLVLETARQVLFPAASDADFDGLPYFAATIAPSRIPAMSRR